MTWLTCKPKKILYREPRDADGLDHCQFRIVRRVSVVVDDADGRDRVDRHAGGWNNHERDGDDAHNLDVEFWSQVVKKLKAHSHELHLMH